jgi:hypothetical protein
VVDAGEVGVVPGTLDELGKVVVEVVVLAAVAGTTLVVDVVVVEVVVEKLVVVVVAPAAVVAALHIRAAEATSPAATSVRSEALQAFRFGPQVRLAKLTPL